MLKRVNTTDLAPGLRTVVSEFESAVRAQAVKADYNAADGDYGRVDQTDIDELAALTATVDRTKQALIRKLLRMQNGNELVDVELLKRKLRRMSRFIKNVEEILRSRGHRTSDDMQGLFAASPEVLEDVERIIAKRRSW